ncbi:MAG: asparagine synthase B, partial [Flavobacteriaceae bacterium]|nr:asparagine synthase B [Flavobacteriaceae bacterium]
MCGIVCAFDLKEKAEVLRPQLLEMSKKIRHRGPDWSGIYADENAILAHERLAIVDPASGKQPLYSEDGKLVLAANGEIYNHRNLRKQFEGKYNFQTESDCEVILALYQEKGTDFLDEMNGIFGFALYDAEKDEYFVARDHVGVIPLYMGWDQHGTFYVASELKALEGVCTKIELFPPGHYYTSKDDKLTQWYKRDWSDYDAVKENQTSIDEIHNALEAAVHRQLMSDVPYGVLLSGGLDSSITSAIAKKYAEKRIESDDTQDAWWPQLHSFSVGLEGSPDLAAAQLVADHIGTIHHEIKFTIQEGLDAIKDVIYNLETYDIT